jgi:hypothetical protein
MVKGGWTKAFEATDLETAIQNDLVEPAVR